MADDVVIRTLPTIGEREIEGLSNVLIDCVEGGASVSFMLPMTREKADKFWRKVADGVAHGERIVIVAEETDGTIVGTVQVIIDVPENQPHRGDIAKMLVHSRARRRGIGAKLLSAAEQCAQEAGKTVLVLDTVTDSDAYHMYLRQGWQRVGEIPQYALFPQGGYCATTYFYKLLKQETET